MKNIEVFNKVFDVAIKDGLLIKDIPQYLLSFLAKYLSEKNETSISISVCDEDISRNKNIEIEVGKRLNTDEISDLGYKKVNRVWENGEYSIFGDVVTVFPINEGSPIRISMFDTVVESITVVDSNTRVGISKLNKYELIENTSISKSYSFYTDSSVQIMHLYYLKHGEGYSFGITNVPSLSHTASAKVIDNILTSYISQGYNVNILYDDEQYIAKNDWLKKFSGIQNKDIRRGFLQQRTKTIFVTQSDIEGEFEIGGEGKSEEIFKRILVGDYIVHLDHGIGIFNGIKLSDGKEYIEIKYAGNDRLLVPMSQIEKISKYVGSGKKTPSITGLNSGTWDRLKSSARHHVKVTAQELIKLYAMRKVVQAPVLIRNSTDKDLYFDFAKSFKHKDTEDQQIITRDIALDLSKSKPMDRLIVGDVGFGKTELACRSAFAAVNAGYQVALLAPTTILAQQHKKVFEERLGKFGYRIESLSRLSDKNSISKTVEGISHGDVDIVIGTHRILQEDIKFKNLSLLIIDEEQKFGVKQKEKLKNSRLDVHVLSMSATPIPRTLNMALTGIRDMSILASVPVGRKAVINKYEKFEWERITSAIHKEIERSGQVYYLHNRVSDIYNIERELQIRLPGVRTSVAHGQLSPKELNRVMEEFINGESDVLVCTTIIENGLDLERVNTLIVDNSNIYGLSQLYQIRGRVGRSERQAYAYFFYDSIKGDGELRLDALGEAEALGSGFIISSRDLEIRGAGNILGRDQSGVINSVGYSLYIQMLTSEVSRLKQGEQSLL